MENRDYQAWLKKYGISKGGEEASRAKRHKEVRDSLRDLCQIPDSTNPTHSVWKGPHVESRIGGNKPVDTTFLDDIQGLEKTPVWVLATALTLSLTAAAVLSYLLITGINLAALAWFYG